MGLQYKLRGREVTEDELKIISDFQMHLSYKSGLRLSTIFRGERLSHLKQKLGVTPTQPNTLLGERLFLIGDKSVHFNRNRIATSNFTIDDVRDEVFRFIFENIQNAATSTKPKFSTYFNGHSSLKDYFADPANKALFVESISTLPNKEKLVIRNYYLELLHQLASHAYKPNSHLLSTTEKLSVARYFSGEKIKDGIIICGWQPRYLNRKKPIDTVAALGLPIYTVPYPRQLERSLPAGLLPHFIVGYILTEQNEFHVNPALFNGTPIELVLQYGFEIDQSSFTTEIQNTGYGGYFIQDGDTIEERTV